MNYIIRHILNTYYKPLLLIYYIVIYNDIFKFFLLYCYWILSLDNGFTFNYNNKNCLICYNKSYYIKYIRCNKPDDHIICIDCYNNPFYDRTRCHFCQIYI